MRYGRAVPVLLGLCGFFLSATIAGQVIFHGQGDTPAISFHYGLLYLMYCGVPGALRGEYPFVIAVICQLIFAIMVYWLARFSITYALILLGSVGALIGVWLLMLAPQLFS